MKLDELFDDRQDQAESAVPTSRRCVDFPKGDGAAVNEGVSAYDSNGTLAWRRATSRYYISSPAESPDGQTIYAVADTFELEAINSTTGAVRWRRGIKSRSSPAIGTDGTIFLGTDRRSVLALRPDGTTRWEYELAGQFNDVFASPALQSDGTVIACSITGTMYALNPDDGSIRWSRQIATDISATPVIGANDAIYLTADDKLRVFNANGSDLWSLAGISLYSASQAAIGADGSLYLVQRYQGTSRLIAIPEPVALAAGVMLFLGLPRRRHDGRLKSDS